MAFKTSVAHIPPIETEFDQKAGCSHSDIANSASNFFVRYTHDNTLCERWYLVQVDLDEMMILNIHSPTMDSYHCVFLARHPNDRNKSDEYSRFWLKWYRYSRCRKTNNVINGDYILIRSSHNPDMNRYVQWSNNMPLPKSSVHSQSILGPFNFERIDAYNRIRQKVGIDHWQTLYDACMSLCITPPTFGSNASHKPPMHWVVPRKWKRRPC